MMLGLLAGFLVMGELMSRFGRKEIAIVLRCSLGIASSVAMLLSYATFRFEFFVIGHFLSGVVAALKVVLLIYLAECSPDDKRGFTSMIVNSGGVIVVLALTPLCLPSLAGSDDLWCLLPLICGLMAIAHLMIAVRFPQSPKQLYIQDHKEEEARAALQYYYGDYYNIGWPAAG
ncbi:MFS domain-containing protein, partial [Trichostrongylus colubriformis]